MSNERIKILKMLENKEITADEASKLLSAIENNNQRSNSQNNNNQNNNNQNNNSFDLSSIMNSVTNLTENIFKKTTKFLDTEFKGIFKGNNSHNNKTISTEFNYNISSNNNIINLSSLNGELVIKGYNGDKLTVKVVYSPKNDETIELTNPSANQYSLMFDEQNFYKVSINVLIPTKYFETIKLTSVNSNFSITNLNFKNIFCKTRNCNGIIENCDGQTINVDNVQGKLILNNIKSDSLNIYNINNYVKMKNIDCKNLNADVLNGEVSIVNDYLNVFNDYNWVIETQNNSINVEINTDNVNYDISAQTSLGKINILKNSLSYQEKSDSRVLAKSENINQSFKNLTLNLQTTNSTIILV